MIFLFSRSISKENKGFKLLSKMGWKEGQTLGKSGEDGLLEPVSILMHCQVFFISFCSLLVPIKINDIFF